MGIINLTPEFSKVVLLIGGIIVLSLCLFWPREDSGAPKKGKAIIALGLVLSIAFLTPAHSLQRRQQIQAAIHQEQHAVEDAKLKEDLRQSELQLQTTKIELESLRTTASTERRLDAEREAANHKALLELTSALKPAGDVLRLYFDESKSGLTFASGRKDLTCDAREKLARIAIYLREERNLQQAVVIGHTDNVNKSGDPLYNQKLSEARAKEVADYLRHAGVKEEILTSKGVADHQPAGFYTDQPTQTIEDNNQTDEQKAKNRRVEIDIRTGGAVDRNPQN